MKKLLSLINLSVYNNNDSKNRLIKSMSCALLLSFLSCCHFHFLYSVNFLSSVPPVNEINGPEAIMKESESLLSRITCAHTQTGTSTHYAVHWAASVFHLGGAARCLK